jgi:hypothetical protein
MGIRKMTAERRLVCIGCAAIAAVPNGGILNYLARDTPLVVWKQLLAVVMAVAAVPVFLRLRSTYGVVVAVRRVEHLVPILFAALAFLAAASLIRGVPGITRVRSSRRLRRAAYWVCLSGIFPRSWRLAR